MLIENETYISLKKLKKKKEKIFSISHLPKIACKLRIR